ncbi:MAG: DNA adenine methylase [Deltaproteobacteria bacterium]|nr:DNA adenine methylase [Deltaproteobacteria bacterium]MDA8178537.1 DNA adenine methylase [Deltaproteobacteria bacterium]
MRYSTPLRYPGGKGKLADFFKLIFRTNNLFDGHYVEPYAGGAGIALTLLFLDYATFIHLNDLNRSVFSFWHSVLNHNDELCKRISDTPVTMKEWFRQRNVQQNPQDFSLLDLGFSTFFMNRTNRSGIITGGVVGGKNQDGFWKLNARFNKKDLLNRIRKVGRYSTRIKLYNEDAEQFVISLLPSLPKKSLIYLDPPYYVKGSGLYENHYKHKDHARVATLVQKGIDKPWVVSYDNTPEIRVLYRGKRSIEYDISYSASNRYAGSEIIFFSDQLEIPDIKNPARLKSA